MRNVCDVVRWPHNASAWRTPEQLRWNISAPGMASRDSRMCAKTHALQQSSVVGCSFAAPWLCQDGFTCAAAALSWLGYARRTLAATGCRAGSGTRLNQDASQGRCLYLVLTTGGIGHARTRLLAAMLARVKTCRPEHHTSQVVPHPQYYN
jgi:hypothetical protein